MNKSFVLSISDLKKMIKFIKSTRLYEKQGDADCGIFQFKNIDILGRPVGKQEYQDIRQYIYNLKNK